MAFLAYIILQHPHDASSQAYSMLLAMHALLLTSAVTSGARIVQACGTGTEHSSFVELCLKRRAESQGQG